MKQFDGYARYTKWMLGGVVVLGLIHAVALAAGVSQWLLVKDILDGVAGASLKAPENDQRFAMLVLLQSVVSLMVAFMGLIWIYKANKMTRALGAHRMDVTPGWSVGWWFVPFANLWMPYRVLSEIWKASNVRANWWEEKTPGFLRAWWLSFICLIALSIFLTLYSRPPLPRERILAVNGIVVALSVINIIRDYLFFTVFSSIFNRQRETRNRGGVANIFE